MSFDPVSAIFGVASKVIDRVWPDPVDQAKAAQALAELQQNGDLAFMNADMQIMLGQIETNKLEAQHGGLFKGGWRPAIGWICAAAMAYKFILFPTMVFLLQVTAYTFNKELFPMEMLPIIEWQEISVVLLGMLGLGGLRSYEKTTVKKS